MRKTWLLPCGLALALVLAFATHNLAHAVPVNLHALNIAASASDVQLARFGGRGGGGGRAVAVRGGYGGGAMAVRGGYRGGAVAVRGHRGTAVAVRGPRGRTVAARGPRGRTVVAGSRYRIGARYHGGIWYGTGRRFWRGRWWAYGVGSCWRLTDIGYVWICG